VTLLTAVLETAPAHGQLTLNPDGSFIYSRFTDYGGDDVFLYQANDGITASAATQVRLGDAAPIANGDVYTVFTNQTLAITPRRAC